MIVSWIYLCLAIILELAGTTSLKLSRGWTESFPSILAFVSYTACFSFFALALKKLRLSVAYATWSGVGTAGVAIISILWLHELVSLVKIAGIALIAIGVLILNLTDKETKEQSQKKGLIK
ncbi:MULTISPECIES: multidrug efflux SMR transporter [Spirulina sp. CCY15215]|uniref:DMT family transporter n=1 Tax=Spirulina sp. CCY15215 TaxID=2767591 RepID=UPI00194DC68E|nr:multidrug efflux SMR transporter [Spirulina major]